MSSVFDAVQSLGIDGVIKGDEYLAPCPAHKERTGRPDSHPSWSINLSNGLHHCFSCGYKGNVRSLISQLVGDEEASEWKITSSPKQGELDSSDLINRLRDVTSNLYIRPPTNNGYPEASLEVFTEPPRWALDEREVDTTSCAEMGALWDSRSELWVLVVRDNFGNILGWQYKSQHGPKVFRNWPAGMHMASCLFGYHYIGDQIDARDDLVVVESPLDAVRLWSFDIPAVALFGSSISQSQAKILQNHHVLLMPDHDDAGNGLRKQADEKLKRVRHVDYDGFPRGTDPGDLSRISIDRLVSDSASTLMRRVGRL